MNSEVAVLTPASAPEPRSSKAAFRLAADFHKRGLFAEAEEILREAIARDRSNADLINARGVMFAAMGRHLDAVWCYRDALVFNPKGSGIWTNLGNALTHLKYLASAIECHEKAIAYAKTGDALLYHNLGTSYAEAGRHGDAIQAFNNAIHIDPGYDLARWDRGRSHLYLGQYREAWPDYEVRLTTGQLPARDLPGEEWRGEAYRGKRLLLVVEQGFGDTIWVARYLARVKALGGELIMECQKELIPLIATLGIADQLVARGSPLPEADYYCYLCSLPGFFTPDLAGIPAAPYLRVPQAHLAKFAPLFEPARKLLKVGIVWSGSITFKRNHERAQPLQRFFQAFALPGVQLYSLQKGPRLKELRDLPKGGPIIDLSPRIENFLDTAAVLQHLDLVIMTDSAVAHLAGALGLPVWLLLGHTAHWLWLQDRTDCPWYPSIRLYRPKAEGDWTGVFDAASVDLMRRVGL